jgi:hypothetical protein
MFVVLTRIRVSLVTNVVELSIQEEVGVRLEVVVKGKVEVQ